MLLRKGESQRACDLRAERRPREVQGYGGGVHLVQGNGQEVGRRNSKTKFCLQNTIIKPNSFVCQKERKKKKEKEKSRSEPHTNALWYMLFLLPFSEEHLRLTEIREHAQGSMAVDQKWGSGLLQRELCPLLPTTAFPSSGLLWLV